MHHPSPGEVNLAVLSIKIANCNSIDSATISMTEGALNIKYGPNGLGKSTLARAIVSQIRADGTLKDLLPFKNRGKPAGPSAHVNVTGERRASKQVAAK
jgi:ABC-type Mn2+/Zn2+ transport system ATPase subunit